MPIKKPEYGVFGLSNETGIEVLNVNKIVAEPLKKAEGLNRYTVPGIDGRGLEGKVSIANGYNLDSELAHVGEVVKITSKSDTLKSVSFPNLDNENEKFLMIFDLRRRDENGQIKPLKIFKQTLEDTARKKANGEAIKKVAKTVLMNDADKVVIKQSTLVKDDLITAGKLANAIAKNGGDMAEGFNAEVNKVKPDMKTLGGYAKFVEIFDAYFNRTDENFNLASKIKRENKLSFAHSDAFEGEKGSIKKAFNFSNLDTIEIATLSDARNIERNVRGEHDDDIKARIDNPISTNDYIIKSRANFFEANADKFYLSIKNKGSEAVGYDNTGNIVLLSNYAYPTKTNGDIYADTSGGMAKALKPSREAFRTISDKLSTIKDASKKPSDEDVSQAIVLLADKAKQIALSTYGEDANVELPTNVTELISSINGNDKEASNKAHYMMKKLHSFVTKAETKAFLSTFDTSAGDFLTKDKARLRGVAFSTDEAERFADDFRDGDTAYDITVVNAKLPTLSFPVEGNDINFKELTAPIVNVYTSRETGNVLSLNAAAGIDSWFKGSGRLGIILSGILNIDKDSADAERDKSNFMNYGFKKNNLGLLGIQKDDGRVKSKLGSHLNTIYNTLKEDGLEAGQKAIRAFANSENPTLATLGRYVEATERHVERNRALRTVRFAVNNKENAEIAVKRINGEKVDFPEKFDAKRIFGVKTASVIIERDLNIIRTVKSTDLASNPVNEDTPLFRAMTKSKTETPIENTAKSIGFAVSSTTNSRMAYSIIDKDQSTDTNTVRKLLLDNSLHAYPSGVKLNPSIESNKWNGDIKQFEAIVNIPAIAKTAEPIAEFDISEELKEIKKEYVANRPTYTATSSADKAAERVIANNSNLQDDIGEGLDISAFIANAVDDKGVDEITTAPALDLDAFTDTSDAANENLEMAMADTTGAILDEIDEVEMSDADMNSLIDDADMEIDDEIGDVDYDEGEMDINIGSKAKELEKTKLSVSKKDFQ